MSTELEQARQRYMLAKKSLSLAQIELDEAREALRYIRETEKMQRREQYNSLLEEVMKKKEREYSLPVTPESVVTEDSPLKRLLSGRKSKTNP